MTRGRPLTVAGRLRAAVEAGAWRQAVRLLPEFQAELEGVLAGLPPGDPEALRLVEEARDRVACMLRLALCQRAHLALELEAAACAGSYAAGRPRRPTWEVRA